MIQRIVCFKFKENTPENKIQNHMNDFNKLKDNIQQILSYSAGDTIHGDYNAKPDYNVVHYMTFGNEKDIDIYFNHKEHKNFIEKNKDIWEKVLVINSKID